MATLSSYQDLGFQVQTNYRNQLATLVADTRLSPEGKREEAEGLYLQALASMETIRVERSAATEARRTELQNMFLKRSVLEGTDPTVTISYRDAYERVSRVDNGDDALGLMNQALATDDVPLQRAILARSFEQRWPDAINAYTTKYTFREAEADELWDLTETPSPTSDAYTAVTDTLAFHIDKAPQF